MLHTKTRIAYLCSVAFIGGAELSLLETLRGLNKTGVEPICILPHPGPYSELLNREGFEVRFLNLPSPNQSRKWKPLKAGWRLYRILRRERISLLHCNSLPYIYPAVLASILAGLPLVMHVRDIIDPVWFRGLRAWFARRVDEYLCITRRVAKPLELLVPARVLYNAIDPLRYLGPTGKLRSEFGMKEEGKLIGIAGYIIPRKGHKDFVQAGLALLKEDPNLCFIIFGEDPFPEHGFRRELEFDIAKAGAGGNFHFTGFRSDLPLLLGDLDVLVMPSWEEPFGRVVLEAWASSVPVVACDSGGVPEVVKNGEEGLLVPPKNAEALAKAISSLLLNEELSNHLRKKGKEKLFKEFTIEKHLRAVQDVYSDLLNKQGS